MMIFVDTSAFYALLDRDDANHEKSKKAWSDLLSRDDILLASNYVIVECSALIQNRLGIEALRGFYEDIMPLVNIEWIDESVHRSGVSALLSASRRKLSLVDCVSFEVMRETGAKTAFAFDPHFVEQGFRCIP
ncbi:MAG TPA: PIN domain-containing protein [Cyclobacteriaceae bacterium]